MRKQRPRNHFTPIASLVTATLLLVVGLALQAHFREVDRRIVEMEARQKPPDILVTADGEFLYRGESVRIEALPDLFEPGSVVGVRPLAGATGENFAIVIRTLDEHGIHVVLR